MADNQNDEKEIVILGRLEHLKFIKFPIAHPDTSLVTSTDEYGNVRHHVSNPTLGLKAVVIERKAEPTEKPAEPKKVDAAQQLKGKETPPIKQTGN